MKKLTFATFAAIGVTAAAVAQPPSEPTPPPRAPLDSSTVVREPHGNDRTNQVSFETADKNKDGTVNRAEANLINGFDFSRADTNNDSTLTRLEFQAAMEKSTPRGDGLQSGDRTEQTTFDKADKDSDGKVSREEAAKIAGFNFSKADVDANSYLTRQEFQSAMASSTPRG